MRPLLLCGSAQGVFRRAGFLCVVQKHAPAGRSCPARGAAQGNVLGNQLGRVDCAYVHHSLIVRVVPLVGCRGVDITL